MTWRSAGVRYCTYDTSEGMDECLQIGFDGPDWGVYSRWTFISSPFLRGDIDEFCDSGA